MKYWVVKLDDNSLRTIGLSHEPRVDAYYKQVFEAPIDEITGTPEEGEWLQIEKIQDEFGEYHDELTVNQVLKDQILQQRLNEKNQVDQKKQVEEQAIRDAKRNIKKITMQNLTDAQSIKLSILALKDAIIHIEKYLINMEEN